MAYPTLGIDVSKLSFDVALLTAPDSKHHAKFENTSKGFTALLAWLDQHGALQAHACMEATALHWRPLARALCERNGRVSVCNPLAIRRYAEASLRRNKTDKADASLIARYCAKEEPRLWHPPSPAFERLKELFRRREQLLRQRQIEQNRQQAGFESPEVLETLRLTITLLNELIAKLEKCIHIHLKSDAELTRHYKLLTTIPGIGPLAAIAILGELGDLTRFDNAKQVAAFAGVTPREHQSGTSIDGARHISKLGSPHLRRVLYMAGITARRCNPAVQRLCDNLTAQRGPKVSKRLLIVAAMHKLLRQAYGVVRSDRPFEPRLPSPFAQPVPSGA